MYLRHVGILAACVAVMGARADQTFDSTSFESLTPGRLVVDGAWRDSVFSGTAASDWSEIVEYGAGETPPAADAGAQYLHVNSGDPLTRFVTGTSSGGAVQINDGLFVDMYVKFSEANMLPSVSSGEKISVWMAGDARGTRRLVVTAGRLNTVYTSGALTAHYSVLVNGGTPDPSAWHRLVIKSYSTVGDDVSLPAFVVFVDGSPATVEGTLTFDSRGYIAISTTKPSRSSTFVSNDPVFPALVTDAALKDKLNAEQLIPSLTTDATLTTVGFAGVGDVDLHSVSDADPVPEIFTSTALNIVAGIGITVVPSQFSDLLPGDSATFTVSVADGFTLAPTAIWGTQIYDSGEYTVVVPQEISTASYTFEINAEAVVATVGGVPYSTLSAAIDAATGTDTPVMIGSDLELASDYDLVYAGIAEIYGFVTIDLNGHEIVMTDVDNSFGFSHNSYDTSISPHLTVLDSVGTGGMAFSEEALETITDRELAGGMVAVIAIWHGELAIEGGTYDAPIVILGWNQQETRTEFTITGGSFSKTYFTETADGVDSFKYEQYVARGLEAVDFGDYWVICESGSLFPPSWNGGNGEAGVSQAILERFAIWSANSEKNKDIDSSGAEAAFLLDAATDEDVSLEPVAISVDANGRVSISANRNLENVNGVVYILYGASPETVVTPVSSGTSSLNLDGACLEFDPGDGAAARFFRIGVGYSVPEAEDGQ